ncbi:hypothetical protein BDF14DRAFT_1743220 [Spinellus fusiger]|nr:hypothetical protein BDF14DRAFT_1743220 [Spinellus fusiger]
MSHSELNSESDDDKMTDTAMATATVTATTVLFPTTPTATATATPELASETILISDAVSHSACDSSSNHTLHKLSKSARIKGPCQACNEVSDSCMRKAFNWPFPTTAVFLDKGRPFVYLCNKCGLRYNKSNGCICHHCRWVFCKEEKRKAAKFIENMRKSRPDGYVGPDEDIEGFVCIPKYWSCGKPWKVGWVLNDLEDQSEEDEFAI